jgi:hypothetical protein
MKKITCILAILAATSTAALAKDLKQDKKATVPAVSATQMTDAEMDKVTAGAPGAGYIYNPGIVSGYPGASNYPGKAFVCINCFF